MKPTKAQKYSAKCIVKKLIIKIDDVAICNNSSLPQWELRHNFTNYDVLCKKIDAMNIDSTVAHSAIHSLQNKINNKIDDVKVKTIAAKNEVIDAQAAEIAQLRALLAAQQTVKVVVQTLEEIAANDYVKADGTYHW